MRLIYWFVASCDRSFISEIYHLIIRNAMKLAILLNGAELLLFTKRVYLNARYKGKYKIIREQLEILMRSVIIGCDRRIGDRYKKVLLGATTT